MLSDPLTPLLVNGDRFGNDGAQVQGTGHWELGNGKAFPKSNQAPLKIDPCLLSKASTLPDTAFTLKT